MATFCSQCGRELKDGEVCNCTQNVQEDGNTWDSTMPSAMPGTGYTDNINFAGNRNVPLFITNLKRILKNPVETASSLVAVKDTDILKGIWILNIIMLFLWVLFVNWKVTDLVQEIQLQDALGVDAWKQLLDNTYHTHQYTWYEGAGFTGILKIMAWCIVIYLIFTALMALVTRLFDKMRKFTFGQACIITGISSLYGITGLVVNTFIFMAIFSKIRADIEDFTEAAALVIVLILIIAVVTLFCSLLSFHIYTESMSSMSIRWTAAYTTICVCRVIVVGILIYFISGYMV